MQLIDTPGVLARDTPNDVERKAEVALRYLAHVIVYVMDPTEASAPLAEQEQLLKETRATGKTILVYLSKTDVASKAQYAALEKKHDAYIDPEKLRKEIIARFKDEFC
jgi:GTP1/Obg family GTP-binding protein